MLFTSAIFLFLFLPITLLIYYLLPKKYRNLFLLVASLGFYTWGEKELVLLIIASTIVDFCCGLIISKGKKRLGLYLSLFFNLSILIYFKYSNFVYENIYTLANYFSLSTSTTTNYINIILPLGISFYTFQTMSYTIDVYRGHVKANKNFLDFATYVALFPQLIAGPIVRYKEIETELKNRALSINQFYEGVERFIIGLGKKIIIANNCALLADGIFALPSNDISFLTAWLGVIIYSLQIYFDFSGYSDMAIGLGKMFGFNFPENFNYPYISKSIQEFWRRWHITLSRWFKDYLYIPLGGNRNSIFRTYINLFIVFFITGLWHGASWNFVLWGIAHGVFIIFEKLGLKNFLNKLGSTLSVIYCLIVVNLTWPLFRCNTIGEAFAYIKSMFSFKNSTNFEYLNFYLSKEILFIICFAIIFSTPVYRLFNNFINSLETNTAKFKIVFVIKIIGLLALFIISYFYIATESYNPFIYFRF